MHEDATEPAPNPVIHPACARRCFVISPIGLEGSREREHADDVFDYIIKPALDECGIVPERADHFHEPGLISEQMLRAILSYDLCIALLTFNNPNVFYELAIAQSAGRPVVILLENERELPFDVKDHRCVYYDLKPRSLMEGRHRAQLISHVRALEAAGWPGTGLPGVSLRHPADRPCDVLPAAREFGVPEDWLALLDETERDFSIAGINLHDWRRTTDFAEAAARKAQDGCRVRVLLLDPDNPAFSSLINEIELTSSLNEVRVGLAESLAFFQRLADRHETIEVRTMRRGCPHYNLTVTDHVAVAIPYLFSVRPATSPLLRCQRGTQLYSTFQRELDSLWDVNAGD